MTESGLRAVYLARRALIERLVRARTNSADEAQDIMQELWIRIEQVRPGPISEPAAYVMRMAMNLVVDRSIHNGRNRNRETAWTAAQPTSSEYPNQESQLLAIDELTKVNQLMDQMPHAMAKALIMFRIEQRPHRAIATELGMSVSGVEKLLVRAYRQLADFQRTTAVSMPTSLTQQRSWRTPDVS